MFVLYKNPTIGKCLHILAIIINLSQLLFPIVLHLSRYFLWFFVLCGHPAGLASPFISLPNIKGIHTNAQKKEKNFSQTSFLMERMWGFAQCQNCLAQKKKAFPTPTLDLCPETANLGQFEATCLLGNWKDIFSLYDRQINTSRPSPPLRDNVR